MERIADIGRFLFAASSFGRLQTSTDSWMADDPASPFFTLSRRLAHSHPRPSSGFLPSSKSLKPCEMTRTNVWIGSRVVFAIHDDQSAAATTITCRFLFAGFFCKERERIPKCGTSYRSFSFLFRTNKRTVLLEGEWANLFGHCEIVIWFSYFILFYLLQCTD